MSAESYWKATLGELQLQMTKATFNTWLKDTRLLSNTEEEYVIGVRNDYAKDWLENRLKETILRTLAAIAGRSVRIRFVVWSDEIVTPAPQVNAAINSIPAAKYPNGRNPVATVSPNRSFTHNFTFASFIVGSSNRLAHAAALSVAENPGSAYNPLFIYGGVGLGKTHLLKAIGHKCLQSGYHVCYITSETFTNDLVQSIRTKRMADFREQYRTPDVLMIDDIQFIAGKESTQEELFHTFNELHSQGKQVVISSDRPPKAMVLLEERLKSRFEWGLMADIQMPDVETRKAILQAKAERSGISVPDEVIELIAQRVRNNIRELEGALNKVMAYAQLSAHPIDANLISMALADLLRQPQSPTIDRVIDAVCDYYNVSRDDLTSNSRKRIIAFPRQMAMFLSRSETDASLPQIGAKLGHRDHSTVMYGCDKIASLLETDATTRRDSLQIKATIYEDAAVLV